MDHNEARQFLDWFPRFEVKPGLSRIQYILAALGNPHLAYPTIHVGGTNGKGSVVAMLDAVLRAAGTHVGRYTSPELIDARDRITLDGEWISESAWDKGIERLAPILDGMDDVPSQFEVVTALAFDAFAQCDVDVAVIEVGLGGRFDATNVVQPEVAILTNVSLDHRMLLGDTVDAIGWEKAGIAKPGTALLTGELPPTVQGIVRRECETVGARLRTPGGVTAQRTARTWQCAVYVVKGFAGLDAVEIPLIGSAQRENMTVALRAVLELRVRGFDVPNRAVAEGLQAVKWPGRMEVVRTEPTVVLDGAHNPASIAYLVTDAADLVPDQARRGLLYGTLADKDVDTILGMLAEGFPALSVCASSSPRALPADRVAARAEKLFARVSTYDAVAEGLHAWRADAVDDDVLFVTGSFTVVGEARYALMEAL